MRSFIDEIGGKRFLIKKSLIDGEIELEIIPLVEHLWCCNMSDLKYTMRTFYVPADKLETLVKFQNKCKELGHKSYSKVLLKLMEEFNDG